MKNNAKSDKNNTLFDEKIQEDFENIPSKDFFCVYFIKEREYLMSKYKDIYVWQLYCYFLENKNLPKFFKSNKQILEELYNCMSVHKLIECKQILVEENILQVIEKTNGKSKSYQFNRLEISIEVQPIKK